MQKTDTKPLWSNPPDSLDLQPDQVDVWRISPDLSPASVKLLESTLSADESRRAARFHFPADRDRYIAAHGCLRDILARYLGCEPAQLTFSTNKYGKPALIGHDLEFNLSHSGDFALVAVTQGRRTGVDVEGIRSEMEIERLASRFFSPREVSELAALPPEQRITGFFNCWTRKEAYIKARGLGLSLPLDSFDVSLAPDEPAFLHATRPDEQEAAGWTLLSLEVDPCYAAAVAAEAAALSLPAPRLRPTPSRGGRPVERSGPGSKGKNLEFRLWDRNRQSLSD
jgi:4'-phosphopantetheinyl transferase